MLEYVTTMQKQLQTISDSYLSTLLTTLSAVAEYRLLQCELELLESKKQVTEETIISSPSNNYITTNSGITVTGMSPKATAENATLQGAAGTAGVVALYGNIWIDICIKATGSANTCDYTASINPDANGNWAATVPLPQDVIPTVGGISSYVITAISRDEFGNSTSISNTVNITKDTNPSITSASVSPLMTGVSKESIYNTLQSVILSAPNPSEGSQYTGPTVLSEGIQSVTIKTHVSQNTKYVKLAYANVNNDPNTPNSTVTEGTIIGYLSNTTDASKISNPLADARVKTLSNNAPQSGACTDVLGCDIYYVLPIKPDATGVYSIIVTAYKGESQEKTTLTYFVDGTLPQTATMLLVDRSVPPSQGGEGVIFKPALLIGGSYYTNTQIVRLRGTATPGSYLTFVARDGRSATDFATPSEHSTPIDLLTDYKVPETGLYEVTLDLSPITKSSSEAIQILGAIKAVTKSPSGDILNTTNSHDGWSIVYDPLLPEVLKREITTYSETLPYIVSPHGTSGTLIKYTMYINKPISYAEIQKEDTFVRIFNNSIAGDVTSDCVADSTSPTGKMCKITAIFNMTKGNYNALINGQTNNGTEGRFHVKVTLNDYAGNRNTYDSQLCYNFATNTVSTSYPCNTLPTEQRDLTGKIDNTPPLTLANPFASVPQGGKVAYDTPLTENSVYQERNMGGITSRAQTVKLKAKVEANSRAMFVVNGQVLKNAMSDTNGLVQAITENCVTPNANTTSSEPSVNMPLIDKLAPDNLIVQHAKLCDVSTNFTFAGDGKAAATDGTGAPYESYNVQIITLDNAGQQSKPSNTIKVYHDTSAPTGEIVLQGDTAYVATEPNADINMYIKAPNGVITTQKLTKASDTGLSIDDLDLIFNEQVNGYGTYTLTADIYDSAGNKSTTTKTIERTQPLGVGGGTLVFDFSDNFGPINSDLYPISVNVLLGLNKQHTVVSSTIPAPTIRAYKNDKIVTVGGSAYGIGAMAKVNINFTKQYIESEAAKACPGLFQFVCRYNRRIDLQQGTQETGFVKQASANISSSNNEIQGVLQINDNKYLNNYTTANTDANTQINVNEDIKIDTAIGTVTGISIKSNTATTTVSATYDLDRLNMNTGISPVSDSSCAGVKISSDYGPRTVYPYDHNGYDLAKPGGCDVVAAQSGIVHLHSFDGGYGNYITIEHNGVFTTLYGHLENIDVFEGQYIYKGQKIGYMGSTGNSEGTHLHFTIFERNTAVNPTLYIKLDYPKTF